MPDLSLLDHPLISARYFFPRRETPPQPHYIDCGDVRLACAHFEHAPEAVTVVHFHGNGEVAADWIDGFEQFILDCGCNLLLAEYRGYGGSGGSPELGKMLADVPRIIESLGKPAGRLVVFGRSVGSLFAIEAVARFPGIRGLIIESGIADVRQRLLLRVTPAELGVSAETFDAVVSAAFNHRGKLAAFHGDLLVLHACGDTLVDVTHGERLYDWGGGTKRKEIFPSGGHNDILAVNRQAYLSSVKSFLQQIGAGGA